MSLWKFSAKQNPVNLETGTGHNQIAEPTSKDAGTDQHSNSSALAVKPGLGSVCRANNNHTGRVLYAGANDNHTGWVLYAGAKDNHTGRKEDCDCKSRGRSPTHG